MSKTIVFDTRQMAFFIYNLFAHDITHDGHPQSLGEERFSKAILKSSDGAKVLMGRKGGGIQEQEDISENINYFNEIGGLGSVNTINQSISQYLVPEKRLFACNLPRTENFDYEKVRNEMSFLIISIERIIDYATAWQQGRDPLYPGFIYINDKVIQPFDLVITFQRMVGGLGNMCYINHEEFQIHFQVELVGTPDFSLFVKYIFQYAQPGSYEEGLNSLGYITYFCINQRNYDQIISTFDPDFFNENFANFMKNTSLIEINGYENTLFPSYIIKRADANDLQEFENVTMVFLQLYDFISNKDEAGFANHLAAIVLPVFETYYAHFKDQYDIYVSLENETSDLIGYDFKLYLLAEIFAKQYVINIGNSNENIFTIIEYIQEKSVGIYEYFKQNADRNFTEKITALMDLVVLLNLYLDYETFDNKDEGSNDYEGIEEVMEGGAVAIPFLEYFVPPDFILPFITDFLELFGENPSNYDQSTSDTIIQNIANDPTTQQKLLEYNSGNGTAYIQALLPRDILPEAYAQQLYGSSLSTTVNPSNLLNFTTKPPTDAEIDVINSLGDYKKNLYNQMTDIKKFTDDLLIIFENNKNPTMEEISVLLINYYYNGIGDKLLPIFVYNIKGVVQVTKIDKKMKAQLLNVAQFEQYMIRQIRIAIVYILTKNAIPLTNQVIINKFLDNFIVNLTTYTKILNIIQQLFDSQAGLTAVQKINSAYMISTAIISVSKCMKEIAIAKRDILLEAQVSILSSVYLEKNVSKGTTGVGNIDDKLFTEFVKWLKTGPKGAGNFVGNSSYVQNNNVIREGQFWTTLLGRNINVPKNSLYYVNNAVNAKVGLPDFFCPFSSIMDGQSTCNSLNSSLKNNGVEFGTMDVIVRDGNITRNAAERTGETMRYHINIRLLPNTSIVEISAFLRIGNEVLINIGSLESNNNGQIDGPDPAIRVDLNLKSSPLEASECLKEIIFVNLNTMTNTNRTIKTWNIYQDILNSNATTAVDTLYGAITPSQIRRKVISASFRKSLGDYLQELNMITENGGYVNGTLSNRALPGTRILDPNVLRLGLSNDRPSGIRLLLFVLFGQGSINENSIGGFINSDGKFLIGIRNKNNMGQYLRGGDGRRKTYNKKDRTTTRKTMKAKIT